MNERDTPLDWALAGGIGRVVVWRTDTGESLSTRDARAYTFSDGGEYVTTGAGTLRRRSGGYAVTVDLAGWRDLAALRRWARDGARVRAALVSLGRGLHVLWDEPVPVVLRPDPAPRGALSADVLTLSTARPRAAVLTTPDLLGPLRFGPTFSASPRTGWQLLPGPSGSGSWDVDGRGRATLRLTGTARARAEVVLPAAGVPVTFSADVVEDADRTGHPLGGPSVLGARLAINPVRFSGADAGWSREEHAFGPGETDVVTRLPEGVYVVRLELRGEGVYAAPVLTTRHRSGVRIPPHQIGFPTGVAGLKDRRVSTDTDRLVATQPSTISDPDGDGIYRADVPTAVPGGTRRDGFIERIKTDDD